jgi:hypothetical protein
MSWKCSGCSERIEDTFETCWNCGKDYDGQPEEVADDARFGPRADVTNEAAPHVTEAVASAETNVDTVAGPLKIPNLPGEHLLLDLHDGDFILTTHRLRHRNVRIGSSSIVSIMLEELASCSLTRRTKPWLLAAAVVCLVLGILATDRRGESFWGAVVVAVVFVVSYSATRQTVLTFASAGTPILLDVGDTPLNTVTRIINQVEAAKSQCRTKPKIAAT